MLISSVFPSKYLTAADLNGKPYTLTIKTVTLEEMVTHDAKAATIADRVLFLADGCIVQELRHAAAHDILRAMEEVSRS